MDLRAAFPEKSAYGDAPIMVHCFHPDHQDDTASLAIYADHFYCYGCGWRLGGRAAAQVIADECNVPLSDVLEVPTPMPGESRYRVGTGARSSQRSRNRSSSAVAGASPTIADVRANPMPFDEMGEAWYQLHHDLAHRQEWLEARGLSAEMIQWAGLGHDDWRFVIPVQARNGSLLTLRYRVDPACVSPDYKGPKYLGVKGRNGLLLYGESWVNPNTDWLVLCEGELDALRLWQELLPDADPATSTTAQGHAPGQVILGHYPAVSATNGARQMEKLVGLIRDLFPKVRHVVIASDQDRAGHEAARDTALALQQAGYTWERACWDTGKDVTEYLQSGGSPELFLPNPARKGNMADIIVRLAHYLAS